MSIEVVETHTILPDLVSPGSIVVDCGANVGRFSLAMIRRFGCACYAIEAAPETFIKIPTIENLHRYNFALCATDKQVTMSIHDEDTTRSSAKLKTNSAKKVVVQGCSLGEFLLHELANKTVDLIKMDIEGAEIEVIDSLSDNILKSVGQWSIEFHDVSGVTAAADVEQRVGRIAELGFYELYWSKHRNNADVLLVNKDRFSARRYILEHHIVRYGRASKRLANRLLCGHSTLHFSHE